MTKEQAINTAVEWWANKLKARTPHSNGDNSRSSVMACLLADMGTGVMTDEKLDIFKRELRTRIEKAIDNRWGEVYLGCDYSPTVDLAESATSAGINLLNFPFKTDLYIKQRDRDTYVVYVYAGYGAPRVELDPVGD